MPGTVMLHAYEMSVEDALSIVLATNDFHDITPDELDELRRAARSIVEAHAAQAACRYVPRLNPEPEPPVQGFLTVVQGGKAHD